jgi:ABC-type glycerol-3-phosphate transport system substrate-binding protein
MLGRACILLAMLIVVVGAIEYVWHLTPLEQLVAAFSLAEPADREAGGEAKGHAVIRLGIASWQLDEFPWAETVRRYEQARRHRVKIRMSALPEGTLNSMLLFWRHGYTEYDVVVAWADEEIHPFINYNWGSDDPARRSLIINVRQYLTRQQLDSFVPALFGGSARRDPRTGQGNLYELPWMGEVLALSYNKLFFQRRGIESVPQTWEEVEQACRKLADLAYKGTKVAPLAMNFSQTVFFGQNCYIPMLAAFKKGRGVADENGRLDVSSPEAVRVFKTLKRWYDAGYVSPNAMVGEAVEQDLRVMRAAMYPHWQSRGLWAVRDNGPDKIGIAPTPGAREAGSLVSTYGCVIPKCSPVIREAVAFCYEALCTDTYGFQTAVAQSGKMPATKQMYERKDLPPGIAELGQSLGGGYSFPDQVNWNQCADILAVEFQRYLAGDVPSADEALRIVQQRFAEEVYREE